MEKNIENQLDRT